MVIGYQRQKGYYKSVFICYVSVISVQKLRIMKIGIINYGAGNIASVKNALDKLGVNSIVSSNPLELNDVDKVIFPGVGHAKEAMANLQKYELDQFIKTTQKPLLGICLGMQMLGSFSEEGETKVLEIIDFEVKKFNIKLKCPHMGWNKITKSKSPLFNGITENAWLYFVHSYFVPISDYSIATANYEIDFCIAVNRKNFWGVQFHPEKSGDDGFQILKNFIELC